MCGCIKGGFILSVAGLIILLVMNLYEMGVYAAVAVPLLIGGIGGFVYILAWIGHANAENELRSNIQKFIRCVNHGKTCTIYGYRISRKAGLLKVKTAGGNTYTYEICNSKSPVDGETGWFSLEDAEDAFNNTCMYCMRGFQLSNNETVRFGRLDSLFYFDVDHLNVHMTFVRST